MSEQHNYTEDNIRSLDWKEHIRLRPGMYIGKLGDGASADDGIYILIKEVIDNSIDEYVMGHGKRIDVTIKEKKVSIRDYGRGIPLGKLVDVVSKINTGAKYDSKAFKKSVGLNGVGTKAVNALSSDFIIEAYRDGKMKRARFNCGKLIEETEIVDADGNRNGTYVEFVPDNDIFKNYHYRFQYIESLLWNYCYLNRGLAIYFNGEKLVSKNGLLDLLNENMSGEALYPIVHIEDEDIEKDEVINPTFFTGISQFKSPEEYGLYLKSIAKNDEQLYQMFASQVFALGKINLVKNNNIRTSTFFFIAALLSELLIIISMAYARAMPFLFPNG